MSKPYPQLAALQIFVVQLTASKTGLTIFSLRRGPLFFDFRRRPATELTPSPVENYHCTPEKGQS